MPVPPSNTMWRGGSPYLIIGSGQRYTIGWHDTRKDGPCFLVARITVMDTTKILDHFPLTEDGWARAWAALVKLDLSAAKAVGEKVQEMLTADAVHKEERERHAQVFDAFVNAAGVTVFGRLGVQVLLGDSQVYTVGSQNPEAKTNTLRLLGPLAGAEAMVTDGPQAWSPGRAMFLPIALTGLATKTVADAAVVFPDGTVHTASLNGNPAVREAQTQVVQFNALAGAATPATTETGTDPAVRLRKLQELRDADLLTQDEYDTKRADTSRRSLPAACRQRGGNRGRPHRQRHRPGQPGQPAGQRRLAAGRAAGHPADGRANDGRPRP